MKAIHILFAIIFISFYSCTDVIVLNLDTAEQKPVIDATLDATHGICTVKMTKSGGFYQTTDFEKISGAQIILSDMEGQSYELIEGEKGIYSIDNVQVVPGKKYTMTIRNVEGKTYTASADAPYPSDIVGINKQKASNISNDSLVQYYSTILVDDNPNAKNYYRIKAYINGKFQADIFDYTDDVFFNGITVEFPSAAIANEQDTVTLELLCVDKKMYQYLIELSENLDKTYNPKGNFGSEVLGRFGIYFTESRSIVL